MNLWFAGIENILVIHKCFCLLLLCFSFHYYFVQTFLYVVYIFNFPCQINTFAKDILVIQTNKSSYFANDGYDFCFKNESHIHGKKMRCLRPYLTKQRLKDYVHLGPKIAPFETG